MKRMKLGDCPEGSVIVLRDKRAIVLRDEPADRMGPRVLTVVFETGCTESYTGSDGGEGRQNPEVTYLGHGSLVTTIVMSDGDTNPCELAVKSITEAMRVVEAAGCHQLLTEAVIALGQAKVRVEKLIELNTAKPPVSRTPTIDQAVAAFAKLMPHLTAVDMYAVKHFAAELFVKGVTDKPAIVSEVEWLVYGDTGAPQPLVAPAAKATPVVEPPPSKTPYFDKHMTAIAAKFPKQSDHELGIMHHLIEVAMASRLDGSVALEAAFLDGGLPATDAAVVNKQRAETAVHATATRLRDAGHTNVGHGGAD
jgi:hypothetical protein